MKCISITYFNYLYFNYYTTLCMSAKYCLNWFSFHTLIMKVIAVNVFETRCIVFVAERRMSYFVAGLTNDNPSTKAPVYQQYYYVQYHKTLPIAATGSVSFPAGQKYRYVIIQKEFPHVEAICLAEVEVFVRSIHAFCVSH